MAYKDIYKKCEKCPVYSFCTSIGANRKAICEQMPTYEELEELRWQLDEAGWPDNM